jgi:DNA-binding NarL/FixJ family response regulator
MQEWESASGSRNLRVSVKSHKSQQMRRPEETNRRFEVRPKVFVFFDRATGTRRFEVKAEADGSMPVEQAVSLLAMQCVVRGQSPGDFRIMISAGENMMDGLVPRTQKLIQACMSTVLPIHISPRQQDVLRGVLQNLANKEIAAKLNVAERTVKFHVSALLRKFQVQGRVGLMQKAGDLLSTERIAVSQPPSPLPVGKPHLAASDGTSLHPKLLRLTASERRSRSF